MKRFMSILLSLMMLVSLIGVMNLAALADEEAPADAAVLVTGGVGAAVNGEGLSYAGAAALKATYDEDAVLLVDAGGFADAAVPVMDAAGYDLVVPETAIEGWETRSISMGVEELSAGAMFPVGGLKIAFIGIAPAGETEAEEYYETIQKSVELAKENGADFVLALGATEDPAALAENVDGLTAVLTYGGDVTELPEPEKTDEEDSADDAGDETEETVTKTPVISVGEGFAAIAVLTFDEDGFAAELMDGEAYAERELEESEDILALQESAAQELENAGESGESTEDAGNADNGESTDGGEDAGESGESTDGGENADNGESTDGGEDAGESGESTEDAGNTDNGESTEDAGNTDETADDGESAVINAVETEQQTDGAAGKDEEEDVASGTDAAAASEPAEEPLKDDTDLASVTDAAPAGDTKTTTTIEWTKGSADLEIKFEHPVSEITIKGSETTVLRSEYYTLADGGKTVRIRADVLNGWGTDGKNNYYQLEFSFSDDAASIVRTINITGTRPAEASPAAPEKQDSTPVVKKTESDVTAAWEAKGLSVTTVKDAIGRAVSIESGYSSTNVQYYDVSVADGVDVSGGVEITLPYPSNTESEGYDFLVVHYLSTGATEIFKDSAVSETPGGLTVKVTSLSPFAVAWKTTAAASRTTRDGSPATGDRTPIGLLIAIFAVLLVAVVVVLVLVIRKGRKPEEAEGRRVRGGHEIAEAGDEKTCDAEVSGTDIDLDADFKLDETDKDQ